MAPFEIMISESQERMLAIVRPASLDAVVDVCRRWGLRGGRGRRGDRRWRRGGRRRRPRDRPRLGPGAGKRCAVAGSRQRHRRRGAAPRRLRARRRSRTTDCPNGAWTRVPCSRRCWATRTWAAARGSRRNTTRPLAPTRSPAASTLGGGAARQGQPQRAWSSPPIRSPRRRATTRRSASSSPSPSAPATSPSPAPGRWASRTASTSATRTCPRPIWQLTESVRGLAEACAALDIPVTGGNVSLYNESPLGRISPTAQIGIVGLLDDIDTLVRPDFCRAGDLVVLLGETRSGHDRLGLRVSGRRRARRSPAVARPRRASARCMSSCAAAPPARRC